MSNPEIKIPQPDIYPMPIPKHIEVPYHLMSIGNFRRKGLK